MFDCPSCGNAVVKLFGRTIEEWRAINRIMAQFNVTDAADLEFALTPLTLGQIPAKTGASIKKTYCSRQACQFTGCNHPSKDVCPHTFEA